NWMAQRLFPDRPPAEEAARLEKLLAAVTKVPLTEAEITRILEKARGNWPQQPIAVKPEKNGILKFPKLHWPTQRLRRVSPLLAGAAAAACLAIVTGLLLWNFFGRGTTGPDQPVIAAQ